MVSSDEKEFNENMMKLWELMMGIAVLIFAAYTVAKDFVDSSVATVIWAIRFTIALLIVFVIFYFLIKQKYTQTEKHRKAGLI